MYLLTKYLREVMVTIRSHKKQPPFAQLKIDRELFKKLQIYSIWNEINPQEAVESILSEHFKKHESRFPKSD
jgi:hypothetical protein